MDEITLLMLNREIVELEQLLSAKKRQLEEAQTAFAKQTVNSTVTQKMLNENLYDVPLSETNDHSPPEAKIALFRSLFKGREDIYAKRFESKKTGKAGYSPVCRNEWVNGICEKSKTSCGNCTKRSFEPVTDEVIRNHLTGFIPAKSEWGKPIPFVMGVYPLLPDETCHFLAVDFDKEAWREDVKAFMDTCKSEGIPAVLERSRSGNGTKEKHGEAVWINNAPWCSPNKIPNVY